MTSIKTERVAQELDSARIGKPLQKQIAIMVGIEGDVAKECEEVLTRLGFHSLRCVSFEEAKEQLEKRSPQLVVVSTALPSSDPLELLRAVKEHNPLITGILVARQATYDFVIKALRVGCDGLVYGDFSTEEFYATVSEALEKSALREDVSKLKSLLSLYRLSQMITVTLDLDRLLSLTLDLAISELHASSGSIMLRDEVTGDLIIAAVHGLPKTLIGKRQSINEGIAGLVARQQKPIIISPSVSVEPQVLSMLKRKEIISSISFPMMFEGKLVGILNVNSVEGEVVFGEGELEILSVLCAQAASAITNARLHEQVRRSYLGAITALVQAIEARDPYTKGHSEKVSEYAVQLGETIKLSADESEAIRMAGLLHDVGKIGIPDQILLKPGKLTEEEYEQIKRHPIISSLIIEPVPFPWDIRTPVRHHHERWDGKGYPDGLRGEEIPLTARIISVTDVFDAITSDRAYRGAMSAEAAFELILEVAGTQLDPELSRAFVNMMRSKKRRS
ncbi:MAG: HD domain-containing protein [Armatimonadota bacterium]|nr:HD domain-containing protein [Armatimonadota bacterium]MCX7777343.1 HD domain-containing protein [Armatimonadota bacterium]MDW8025389.1 HD domain-containing protein [Armatimonadota bacterium]